MNFFSYIFEFHFDSQHLGLAHQPLGGTVKQTVDELFAIAHLTQFDNLEALASQLREKLLASLLGFELVRDRVDRLAADPHR